MMLCALCSTIEDFITGRTLIFQRIFLFLQWFIGFHRSDCALIVILRPVIHLIIYYLFVLWWILILYLLLHFVSEFFWGGTGIRMGSECIHSLLSLLPFSFYFLFILPHVFFILHFLIIISIASEAFVVFLIRKELHASSHFKVWSRRYLMFLLLLRFNHFQLFL